MRSLVLVALAAACYRGTSAPPVQPQEPRPRMSAAARTANDPLGFLPIDAEVVARLDANQLRQSTLWSRIEPRLMEKAADTVEEFSTACGFDPLQMIEYFAVGLRRINTPELAGVLVIRGVPRAQMMPCIQKATVRNPGVGVIDRNGILTVHDDPADPDDSPIALAYADARTMVVLVGHGATAPALAEVLERGAPLRASQAFMDMFARIDPRRAVWFVMNGTSKIFDTARFVGFRPRALFGAADASSGVAAKIVVRMDTAADAQTLVTTIQGQITAVQSLVAKLEVVAEAGDVVIDLALTDDQLAMIAGLLGP